MPRENGRATSEHLPAGGIRFVARADIVERQTGGQSRGLSPLKPGLAAIAAARMVLREIDRLAKARVDFAFESTLPG